MEHSLVSIGIPAYKATFLKDTISSALNQTYTNIELIEVKDEGIRVFEMLYDGIFYEILDKLGNVPLPPYIKEKLVKYIMSDGITHALDMYTGAKEEFIKTFQDKVYTT